MVFFVRILALRWHHNLEDCMPRLCSPATREVRGTSTRILHFSRSRYFPTLSNSTFLTWSAKCFSRAPPTRRRLAGMWARGAPTSTRPRTPRLESITNAFGARSSQAMETPDWSEQPSERTCHQEPWDAPLESCFTLTSKSENLFESHGCRAISFAPELRVG